MSATESLRLARLRGIQYAIGSLTLAVLALAMGSVPDGGGLLVVFAVASVVLLGVSFLVVRGAVVRTKRDGAADG